MKFEYMRYRKVLVRANFFEKSYKNTRTKIPVIPYGVTGILLRQKIETPLDIHTVIAC